MRVEFDILRRLSLKGRITVFMLLIFVCSIWALSYYASYMLSRDMEKLLGEQQASTAAFVAMETNRKLEYRLDYLDAVAKKITPDMLDDITTLKAFLNDRITIQKLFNGGVLALDSNGVTVVDTFDADSRVGISYMDREYVKSVFKTAQPIIGSPVIGKKPKTPLFGMAVAIKDSSGRVAGVLIGVTNLDAPNFLDEITNNKYGKSGYYLLEEPKNRMIITSTSKNRAMQPLPPPGVNHLIDRHVNGYDDTGITVNPLGVEVLASARRVPAAGWFVVAAVPTKEAFAPIRELESRILTAAIFFTFIAGVLTWWMVKRQLSPMLSTVKTLADMSNEDSAPRLLPFDRKDEIGGLISGFNHLLEKIGERERALMRTEETLRSFNATLSKQVEEEVAKRLSSEKSRQKEREALIQSEKMAQLGNMLGVILHQWKQPLSAIAIETQGLRDSYKFDELDGSEVERVVSSIMSKISFMSATANDFMNFYRPSKESKAFCIIEHARMVVRLLEKQLKISGINLVLEGDESVKIVGCAGEFKQVMLNIINNAKDALEERKIEHPTININIRQENAQAIMEIEDNAGGAPNELMPNKLFEQFVSTKGEGGTGIGLSISRTIIEEHLGGKISVRNTQHGARFRIEVPCAFDNNEGVI